VCCAAITESGELLRLYPIRYRQLKKDQKFQRFDLLEVDIWRAEKDPRPESHKVKEDTIKIIERGGATNPDSKYQLWCPLVLQGLEYLKKEQKVSKKSLGIIKPDTNSIIFHYKLLNN
jgi:hypothetical protein